MTEAKQSPDEADTARRPQKILRRGDLPTYSGLSIGHIYAMIAKGTFPPPIRLGEKASGWLESDIIRWQEERIERRNEAWGIGEADDAGK